MFWVPLMSEGWATASVDSVKIASLRRNCMEYERNEKRSIGRLPCQHHHFKRTRFGRLSANPPSNILAIREFIPPPACLRYFVLTWARLEQSHANAKTHMPTYCCLYYVTYATWKSFVHDKEINYFFFLRKCQKNGMACTQHSECF